MRALEAIAAKGETSALCQSIGVSRASLYRRRRPTPPATAPNQVWSWDITKLKGPVPYLYYSLYVILDLFSRYVVGWMVAVKESAHLAQRLIEQTCAKQRIQPQQLTIHADRRALRRAPAILDLRHRTRLVAYSAHPERFVSGPPRPETSPTAVWINPPSKTTSHDAPRPTTGTPDDSQHAVVVRPRPPLDRSSLHRVDGVESLQ